MYRPTQALAPRRTIALAALLASGALWGCTSRTLPLPPPDVQEVTAPDADGRIFVRGLALEGTAVGVLNDADGVGAIVSPETGCDNACPFEAEIAGQSGDPVRVWQFFETSSSTDTEVP